MNTLTITPDNRGHLDRVLKDLIRHGWVVESIPVDGRIPRNGVKLVLKFDDGEIRVRLLIYKVTTSGRSRPHERRVEITTTYRSGLKRSATYRDVVLGIDESSGKYVGIDSRRLRLGGRTHNASSFFDLEGLSVKPGELLINPRSVTNQLFPGGVEHHAFFDGSRLGEYLFNHRDIHSGLYTFGSSFARRVVSKVGVDSAMAKRYKAHGDGFLMSARIKQQRTLGRISKRLIAAVEKGDFSNIRKRGITPEQLRKLISYCDEIGILGEQIVLTHERKRLRKLGFDDQANRVERVSLRSVSEGFDILSFEDDGVTKRYLEVKATIGISALVDMSLGEWKAAQKFAGHYYLVRVTRVKDAPRMFFIRDPVQLEVQGFVTRTPTGWKVDLSETIRS